MSSWPILSITTFLPVLGILFIAGLNRDDEVAKRKRAAGRRCGPRSSPSGVSLLLVWRFDPASPEFQFVEKACLAWWPFELPHGRRRHLAAVRDPHHGA